MERETPHVCDLETLKELNAKAVEQAPDAMIFADMEGTIVEVNASAELMFGYHRNELLGEKVEILMPEAARKRHTDHRVNYSEDPRTRDMGLGMKLRARAKNGKEFDVEIKLSPIVVIGAGIYIMTVIRRVKRQLNAPAGAPHDD